MMNGKQIPRDHFIFLHFHNSGSYLGALESAGPGNYSRLHTYLRGTLTGYCQVQLN
jgi:hypothetical protein